MRQCPFCGGDEISIRSDRRRFVMHYWVECMDCGASGPPAFSAPDAAEEWDNRPEDQIALTEAGRKHLEGRK